MIARSAAFVLAVLASSPAAATWSIVAVDPATREVGVAGASCIEDVDRIAGLAPGRGAVAAQSVMNAAGRDRAVERLLEGRAPLAVLKEITSPDFDAEVWLLPGGRTWRQYGIASLDGPRQAAWTGEDAIHWAGSMEAPGVVAAGNMLVGPEVVGGALLAFAAPFATQAGGSEAEPCEPTLGDRLVAALVAGADAGGDKRCVPELAALSAFVEVARPDDPPDAPSLRIVVPWNGPREEGLLRQAWRLVRQKRGSADENPVHRLRERYLAWSREQGRRACLATRPD